MGHIRLGNLPRTRKFQQVVQLLDSEANAQRKGWAVCPGKSLPARGIEESVLGRIREAQHGILDPSEWAQMDRTRQVEAIQAMVERIGYDGAARQISIRFRQSEIPRAEQEAGA